MTDVAGGLYVDSTGIYWSGPQTNSMYMCPATGCEDGGLVTLATGFDYPNAIAVSNQTIYIAVGNQDTTTDGGDRQGIFGVAK
jgi:hypothetical protein